jgi:hypothetical protein
MTNELELNARFELLIAQRNNAMNQNVLDAGTIAALQAKVKELEGKLAGPTDEEKESAIALEE